MPSVWHNQRLWGWPDPPAPMQWSDVAHDQEIITLWRVGPLRWWTRKEHLRVSWHWECCNRKLNLGPWPLLRLHWHDGWHDNCEPGWPPRRMRAIRLFTWNWRLPWRYYPS